MITMLRKKVSACLVLCGGMLLLLCMSGCRNTEANITLPTQGASTESTEPATVSDTQDAPATDADISTESDPVESVTEATTEVETTKAPMETYPEIPSVNCPEEEEEDTTSLKPDLILALEKFWDERHAEYDMPATSLGIRVKEIKNGAQPLHVQFDPSRYYFACAYLLTPGRYDASTHTYIKATYTWVRYNQAEDIQEYYDGDPLYMSYQINKAAFCRDILPSGKAVPRMDHFQIYRPSFFDGMNITPPIYCDDTFIYLNTSEKATVYHSIDAYYHKWVTTPCTILNNQCYLIVDLLADQPDEVRDYFLSLEFEPYYDTFMDIMQTGLYSVTDAQGKTREYGILRWADVVYRIIYQ